MIRTEGVLLRVAPLQLMAICRFFGSACADGMSQIVSVPNRAKLPKVPGLRRLYAMDEQSMVLPLL